MTASLRHTIRIVVFASALLVALLFAEHEARADDLAPVSTPAPDPGGGTPPLAGNPPALPPVVDVPTPAPTPDPAPPVSLPPIIPGGSIDSPPTPPPPHLPDEPNTTPPTGLPGDPGGESHGQVTQVITGGTAVANTGGNRGQAGAGSANGESAARPTKPLPFSGTMGAVVRTGNAGGRGSVDESGIKQGVDAIVTENGKVTVVQVAIVVNVGIGIAGSGHNTALSNATVPVAASVALVIGRGETAAGGSGPGGGSSLIATGNAFATGNAGTTKVTQSLVLTGRDVSEQLASVLNLGVGVANTGLNLALAAVSTNNAGGPQSATFISLGGGSNIGTGAADALGNRSTSAVLQKVTVTASGNGSLTVIQRAVIVNFGLAIANTGFNSAGASFNGALPGIADAQQLLLALLGSDLDSTGPAPLGGSVTATIGTGVAGAIGNDTKTGIIQKITGSVSGDDTARAIQDAWVGNFGVGIANSGGNGAGGLSGLDAPALGAARDALRAFLGGLTGVGDPVQGLDASFELGGNLLQLQGDVSGTETLLGVAEPSDGRGEDDASLVVRQVTAVLNIGLALGDSGHNLAVAGAVSGGTTEAGPDDNVASVSIVTGDARALGSHFAVTVCQAIGDELTCAEPPPPPPPPPPPEEPQEPQGPPAQPPILQGVPEVVPRPAVAVATLPFTGSPIGAELAAGSTLLIAGMLMARRRRLGARR